jgi:hypothetical protein
MASVEDLPHRHRGRVPLDLRVRWTQESGSKKIGLCVPPWLEGRGGGRWVAKQGRKGGQGGEPRCMQLGADPTGAGERGEAPELKVARNRTLPWTRTLGFKKSDSSVDSDSWVQSQLDSSLDSDSRVQSKSDSSLDSDSGTRARSDSGLDSGSWLSRAWGLAVGLLPGPSPPLPRSPGPHVAGGSFQTQTVNIKFANWQFAVPGHTTAPVLLFAPWMGVNEHFATCCRQSYRLKSTMLSPRPGTTAVWGSVTASKGTPQGR